MENQRVRLSKLMLKNALIDLLQEKSLETITIYALCQKASVNRTTFYKYYGSQYDLLADIEKDVFDEVQERLQLAYREGNVSFRSALDYISQERKKCLVLMNSTVDKDFAQKLFQLPTIDSLMKLNLKGSFPGMEHYVATFLYNGGYAVIRDWANGGFQESPEQIEALMLELMGQGCVDR